MERAQRGLDFGIKKKQAKKTERVKRHEVIKGTLYLRKLNY